MSRHTRIYLRFIENVRDELERQEKTQRALAKDIGISYVQMCRLLKGHGDPSLSMCTRIADALGCPVGVLLIG